MSDSNISPKIPNSPPSQRNGCLTAFLVIAGLVLLLPGLCTIIVTSGHFDIDPGLRQIEELGLFAGLAGIVLIVVAVIRPGGR
jgi:hypothetical protein